MITASITNQYHDGKRTKSFTNILISSFRSWSHAPCSATIISAIRSRYCEHFLLSFPFHYSISNGEGSGYVFPNQTSGSD